MSIINVAIDGPSGAGKSTIARAVAKKAGYIYIDTGALYRTIALYSLREQVDTKEPQAVSGMLSALRVELTFREGEQRVLLNGEDVSGLIRTPEVSMAASTVSAIPAVRAFCWISSAILPPKTTALWMGAISRQWCFRMLM